MSSVRHNKSLNRDFGPEASSQSSSSSLSSKPGSDYLRPILFPEILFIIYNFGSPHPLNPHHVFYYLSRGLTLLFLSPSLEVPLLVLLIKFVFLIMGPKNYVFLFSFFGPPFLSVFFGLIFVLSDKFS